MDAATDAAADEATATALPVYLLECDTWSDGASDHEEDHNIYYDMKYFYLVNEPFLKIRYSWFCYNSTAESGMVTETRTQQHLDEMNRGEKVVASMPIEEVIRLLKKEVPELERRMHRPRFKPTGFQPPASFSTPLALGGWSITSFEPVEVKSEEQIEKRLYDTVCDFIKMHDK